MRLDVFPEDQWLDLNERIRNRLDIQQNRVTTRAYRGVAHALKEFAVGLSQSFPHKKSVAIIQHVSPWFGTVENLLMREAYCIQAISIHEDLIEWANQLAADTVFALIPEDHAITAEVYDHSELVDTLLKRGIFVIRVSHFKHRFSRFSGVLSGEVRPTEIRVLSYAQDFTVGVMGGRSRLNPLVSSDLYWQVADKRLNSLFTLQSEDQNLIEQFEAEPAGRFVKFISQSERIWDRALIEFKNVSGDFAMHKISQHLGLSLGAPGEGGLIETTQLCRWNGFKLWKWTDRASWSKLLLIDVELLSDKRLDHVLTEIASA